MQRSAERMRLLAAQSLLDGEAPTIEAALNAQTRGLAALWAGFTVFASMAIAVASQHLEIAAGGVVAASFVYALLRSLGRSRSTQTATLQQKFITRKKRREVVVFGRRSLSAWTVPSTIR